MQIPVTAKVDGYHPSTGLHLCEGESYTIDEQHFSGEVFERKNERPVAAPTDEGGTE